MLKLTVLHYKLFPQALERFHNINEHSEGLMFDWESSFETAKSVGGEYPAKPFMEPFEFEDEDYEVTKLQLRIKKEDILIYRQNVDKVTEIVVTGGEVYPIEESIDFLDNIFDKTE